MRCSVESPNTGEPSLLGAVEGLTIVLTKQLPQLTGRVVDNRGNPADGTVRTLTEGPELQAARVEEAWVLHRVPAPGGGLVRHSPRRRTLQRDYPPIWQGLGATDGAFAYESMRSRLHEEYALLVAFLKAHQAPWELDDFAEATRKVVAEQVGIFGEADHIISLDDVVRFRNALEKAKKNCHIRIYAGAPHGWLNDTMPGRFRADAAESAIVWLATTVPNAIARLIVLGLKLPCVAR
mgnify:CR=1 FL=1